MLHIWNNSAMRSKYTPLQCNTAALPVTEISDIPDVLGLFLQSSDKPMLMAGIALWFWEQFWRGWNWGTVSNPQTLARFGKQTCSFELLGSSQTPRLHSLSFPLVRMWLLEPTRVKTSREPLWEWIFLQHLAGKQPANTLYIHCSPMEVAGSFCA